MSYCFDLVLLSHSSRAGPPPRVSFVSEFYDSTRIQPSLCDRRNVGALAAVRGCQRARGCHTASGSSGNLLWNSPINLCPLAACTPQNTVRRLTGRCALRGGLVDGDAQQAVCVRWRTASTEAERRHTA
eukprot:COSAG02_NODE_4324_length_5500_cov_4.544714_2_plen_129_part_00